jgi:hypothetical protein
MLSKAEAKKIMLGVKDTHEQPYFGKPAVFFGESFIGRVHDKEEAVALRVGSIEMRDVMLEAEPKLFYITEHYKPWPMLLARLKVLDRTMLKELVLARIGEVTAKAAKKRKAPAKKAAKPAKTAARKAKKLTKR